MHHELKFYIETERLILRDMVPEDAEGLFRMDSDPEVHTYLGNNPVKDIEHIRNYIESIRQQYIDNGIGRWVALEKATGEVIGWTGLKLLKDNWNGHTNVHDVGYRLAKKFWNKGYATESTIASLKYAFEVLNIDIVYGSANIGNTRSRRALEKCGLTYVEQFYYGDILCDWLKISKEDWLVHAKK